MATTEIAATPELNADVLAQLLDMAGYIAGEHTIGMAWRAQADFEDFMRDPSVPSWFRPGNTVGERHEGMDYAFRELMHPERRAAMAARIREINANRVAHYGEQYCDALPIDAETAITVAGAVLDGLARQQDSDRLLDVSFDGGFWEDYIGELLAFFETGEITDRS